MGHSASPKQHFVSLRKKAKTFHAGPNRTDFMPVPQFSPHTRKPTLLAKKLLPDPESVGPLPGLEHPVAPWALSLWHRQHRSPRTWCSPGAPPARSGPTTSTQAFSQGAVRGAATQLQGGLATPLQLLETTIKDKC